MLFLIIAGCVEPYEFLIHEPSPGLVIEASISDKSFDETLLYPSDGRYFTVKLSLTGDVTNVRPTPVGSAIVTLESSDGRVWAYTEDIDEGAYSLLDKTFKADRGIQYRLRVALPDEHLYESEWESLPEVDVPPMGEIGFTETEKEVYVMEALDWVIRTKKFVTAKISVPENETAKTIFYRWTFSPMWIYVAPLVSQNDPVYRCWATDRFYLNTYAMQADRSGGYQKDLFDIVAVRNERLFEKFSVLITQHAMTESYYHFWKEMKDRNEGSALIDAPPYNLQTNFHSPTGGRKVSGYFGVAAEQARRWYFDKSELSYYIENTMRADCLVVYGPGPPAEECLNCTAYSFGDATTTRPSWWQQ